ncbi:MAG: HEAT repeat domain-containing protein [Anaerolineae bacterium]|nr:HEAT repeat domain-containing protein [Anaerolineae bacterium]
MGGQLDSVNSTLDSLRLLRSDDPAERKRGIADLRGLSDDPRVLDLLDDLYHTDPDPEVREMAGQAIEWFMPDVPAPGPELAARGNALIAASKRTQVAQAPQARALASPPAAARTVRMRRMFLLTPGNAKFVARRVSELSVAKRSRGREAFFVAGIVLLVVAVLGLLVLPNWIEPDSGTLSFLSADYMEDQMRDRFTTAAIGLIVVFGLLLILGLVQRRRPYVPKQKEGNRLLKGRVVACTGHLDGEGDYYVKLRYQFRSPSGRKIVYQASRIRNDLKNKPLPAAGTPVAVYYRHDRSFRVL